MNYLSRWVGFLKFIHVVRCSRSRRSCRLAVLHFKVAVSLFHVDG